MELRPSYVPIDDLEHVPPEGFVSYWDWKARHDNADTVRTGRLAPWLREAASGSTVEQRLVSAVLRRIDPARTATRLAESNAFADLAVTGRDAFAAFYAAGFTDARLLAAARAAMPSVDVAAASTAVREVLDRALTVVGALRGAPAHRQHFRRQLGWIAVAGDVDAPHAPVNVGCTRDHMGELTVRLPGDATSVQIRASLKVAQPPVGPGLPTLASRQVAAFLGSADFHEMLGPRRTAYYDSLVLFLHGLGSRLEESDHYKQLLIDQGLLRGHRYGILSIDLPGFGYSRQFDVDELVRRRVGTGFHGFVRPSGAGSQFPVLGYFRDVIATLSRQIPGGIQHVMGGSLGGNLSLWAAEDPLFTTLPSDRSRIAGLESVAAWSPASIWESYGRSFSPSDELVVRAVVGDITAVMEIVVKLFEGAGDGRTHVDVGKAAAVARTVARMNMPEVESTRANEFFGVMQRGEALAGARVLGAWGHPSTPSGLLQQAEIYSERYRKTFWATAYEQLVYSHQEPLAPGGVWPFRTIKLPLLLGAGANDTGDLGVMDIYNPTVQVSLDSPFVSGRRVLMHETGHSISDEHPYELARQVDRFFLDAPRIATWERMPGSARDIGIGTEGTVYVIGTDSPHPGNGGVHRWDGRRWQLEPNAYGTRISVDNRGQRWVVNSRQEIYTPTGRAPGSARDVGIGPEGTVYVVGTDTPQPGNGGLYRWSGTAWVAEPGAYGTRVAVDARGARWAVNSRGEIWGPDGLKPGSATDIAAGADGSVWVIGTDRDDAGNGGIHRFEAAANNWRRVDGKAVAIAVEPSGRPWVVTSRGEIYRMTRAPG